MKKIIFAVLFIAFLNNASAQAPVINSWVINTTGATGYNNIISNVQSVAYDSNNVYISASCIPGYSIGPWQGNPNTPVNKNFVYKITRTPVKNNGTPTPTGLGHTGVWSNGVSVFNSDDGMSYNNQNIWNRNAYFWEGASFDNCLGHPAPGGEYHHHVSPKCLYDVTDSTHHSPIIGYSFDGFPIYGAYGYADTNGVGPIKRMRSSFATTAATTRTNGPAVNATYPMGCFIEDWVYTAGLGDLDDHNGRFCVTPEYPNGIYAYFVTIDDSLLPVYPFTPGPTYYGVVTAGNTGMNGGHNTIPSNAVVYNPATGIDEASPKLEFAIFPNPVKDQLLVSFNPSNAKDIKGEIYNAQGALIESIGNMRKDGGYPIDVSNYAVGNYFIVLSSDDIKTYGKFLKIN